MIFSLASELNHARLSKSDLGWPLESYEKLAREIDEEEEEEEEEGSRSELLERQVDERVEEEKPLTRQLVEEL